LIVSSPAVRAWTTAKVFATELGYPIEFLQREDDIYLASLDSLLDVVASQDNGFNNLMLFGHNPGLTDFANYLSSGLTNNLPTAGIVSVQFDRDDWQLYERPKADLLVYDYPKKQL
jgi:phosphohistidine phosphatase